MRAKKTQAARERAARIAEALSGYLGEPTEPQEAGRRIVCTHCATDMVVVRRGGMGIEIDQCEACGGVWLDVGELDTLLAEVPIQDQPADRKTLRKEVHVHTSESKLGVEYRKCPRCDDVMMRRNFGGISGVIIDECSIHGVYLDAGELEALETFIRLGGLQLSKQADQRTRARQQREQPPPPKIEMHRPSGGGALSQLWMLFFG